MAIYEDVRVIYSLLPKKGEEPGEPKQRLLEGILWEFPVVRLGKGGILTAFTGLTIIDSCGGEWFVDKEGVLYKVTGGPEEPAEALPWGRDADVLV